MDKNTLRKEMMKKRNELEPDFVTRASLTITETILGSREWKSAKTVMLYSSFKNEPGTEILIREALRAEKTAVLPFTDPEFQIIPYIVPSLEEKYFQTSPLGIREPSPAACERANPEKIDLILFPGVVFDQSGNRIGFGKGCYDRFLRKLDPDVPRWALAYDFQVLEHIPSEKTDIPASALVTETGIRNIYLNFCGLSI